MISCCCCGAGGALLMLLVVWADRLAVGNWCVDFAAVVVDLGIGLVQCTWIMKLRKLPIPICASVRPGVLSSRPMKKRRC